jgi:hypothetical protein
VTKQLTEEQFLRDMQLLKATHTTAEISDLEEEWTHLRENESYMQYLGHAVMWVERQSNKDLEAVIASKDNNLDWLMRDLFGRCQQAYKREQK